MSNSSGYASEPMPFSEYAGVGASYPTLTTLSPLANPESFPKAPGQGQLSTRAAALKARLAGNKAEEEDANAPGSLVHPAMSPLSAGLKQPMPAGPSLTTAHGPLGDPASPPSAVYAYSPAAQTVPQMPAWQPPPSNTYGTTPLPARATRGTHPSMSGDRLDRLLTMLEQQAMGCGGARAGPDTTTEDLVSLAFVGIFFMLAVHALTPPVPYRR